MMIRISVGLAVAVLVLAGCAKVGTLDRPAPLFGEKAKAEYRAQKAAAEAAKAKKPDEEPEPLPTEAPPEANPPVSGSSSSPQ
jgi:hypothetical protein